MPANYVLDLKTRRMQDVADRVMGLTPQAATGTPTQGKLVIGTRYLSGSEGILATFTLSTDPFTCTNSLLIFKDTPLVATPTGTGDAALAELRDANDNTIAAGLSVSTFGADINLSTVALQAGIPTTISTASIRHG